jgi:hypothetical protein
MGVAFERGREFVKSLALYKVGTFGGVDSGRTRKCGNGGP